MAVTLQNVYQPGINRRMLQVPTSLGRSDEILWELIQVIYSDDTDIIEAINNLIAGGALATEATLLLLKNAQERATYLDRFDDVVFAYNADRNVSSAVYNMPGVEPNVTLTYTYAAIPNQDDVITIVRT